MTANRATTLDSAIAASASKTVAALIAYDKAASKASEAIAKAMGDIVTAATASGLPRNEKGVKHLMQHVRECQTFIDAAAEGLILAKTITEYAQGVGRAFFHGCEWTPRLKNDPSMALPWGKAKPKASEGGTEIDSETTMASKAKPGKVKTVSKDDAFATARLLLSQLRALNLSSVAADILDEMLEVEGFSETV